MDNQWRTDEPEQGQLAQIIDEQGETHLALGHNGNGLNEFGWETDSGWLDFHQVLKWLPLSTPVENRLRDLLRWRKWPEESPTETGYYIVWKFNLSYTPNGFYSVNSDSWDVMWKRFYWMPQMPLPEVES